MSFYNFKLNDPASSFSTSSTPDSKTASRFVHKTTEDFQHKNYNILTIAPKETVSNTIINPDGQAKFAISGWKETQSASSKGATSKRYRLPPPKPPSPDPEWVDEEEEGLPPLEFPEELRAVSITSSLQSITHTYSPLPIGELHSLGSPTSIRLVKLAGQGVWHVHENTDEVFIILRGAINMLYRTHRGEGGDKIARVIGGELLRVPMRMEHCVVAEDGTEVLLLEGSDIV